MLSLVPDPGEPGDLGTAGGMGAVAIPEQESDETWGNLVSQVEQDKEGSVAIICGSCLL